jgi:hypothetical protein
MPAFADTKEIARRFEHSWEIVNAPRFPDGFLNS